MQTKNLALILIILLGTFLRVYHLNQGDVLGDEALLGFRSVGLTDFDEAPKQTTPLEWFDGNIPWWTKLSFHDHPPLVFWIQHSFISVSGETAWAFRLPSAIFGIASIYLLYLLGKSLYEKKVGLLAALLLAVNSNHVYISRIGLQESYVIFFILLTIYAVIRTTKNPRFFLLVGASLGLGLLTKYTAIILIPLCLVYLLIYNRGLFKSRFFYFGAGIALLIVSPIIVYNLMLYSAVGHFDFQLSYIFGQHPKIWQENPGKQIGSFLERLTIFPTRLFLTYSPFFLISFFSGLAWLMISRVRKKPRNIKDKTTPSDTIVFLSLTFLTILIIAIGPSYRFITMLAPVMALTLGTTFAAVTAKKMLNGLIFTAVGIEIIYSINTNLALSPRGIVPWAYAATAEETRSYGYHQLATYFNQELKNLMPALTLEPRYKFLNDLQTKSLAEDLSAKKLRQAIMIIYDDSLQSFAQLWYLDRLQVYKAWPVLKLQTHQSILAQNGENYFRSAGFSRAYFILPTKAVPLKSNSPTSQGLSLAHNLQIAQQPLAILKNDKNFPTFYIYKFTP